MGVGVLAATVQGPACRPWVAIGRALEDCGASVTNHRRGSMRILISVASMGVRRLARGSYLCFTVVGRPSSGKRPGS
eukprot:1727386-Pyramimonas_sp.AAC.1